MIYGAFGLITSDANLLCNFYDLLAAFTAPYWITVPFSPTGSVSVGI